MAQRDKYALLAIIAIGVTLELYRPLGISLAILAIVAMLYRLTERGIS